MPCNRSGIKRAYWGKGWGTWRSRGSEPCRQADRGEQSHEVKEEGTLGTEKDRKRERAFWKQRESWEGSFYKAGTYRTRWWCKTLLGPWGQASRMACTLTKGGTDFTIETMYLVIFLHFTLIFYKVRQEHLRYFSIFSTNPTQILQWKKENKRSLQ